VPDYFHPRAENHRARSDDEGSLEIRSTEWFFEIAGMFVRLDHIASFIVNANHSVDEVTARDVSAITGYCSSDIDGRPSQTPVLRL
jgi:hypothetical protein